MFELEPIKQSDSLSDEVARRLRRAIKRGDLPRGTHLVEQEIAEQFHISRMPVRIGIQKLIDEGLVFKEAEARRVRSHLFIQGTGRSLFDTGGPGETGRAICSAQLDHRD